MLPIKREKKKHAHGTIIRPPKHQADGSKSAPGGEEALPDASVHFQANGPDFNFEKFYCEIFHREFRKGNNNKHDNKSFVIRLTRGREDSGSKRDR